MTRTNASTRNTRNASTSMSELKALARAADPTNAVPVTGDKRKRETWVNHLKVLANLQELERATAELEVEEFAYGTSLSEPAPADVPAPAPQAQAPTHEIVPCFRDGMSMKAHSLCRIMHRNMTIHRQLLAIVHTPVVLAMHEHERAVYKATGTWHECKRFTRKGR